MNDTPTPPSFAEADTVALLGRLSWSRYRLNGNDLKLERPLDGTTAKLLKTVLSFRVQYGVSADNATGTLSGWQDASGATFGTASGDTLNRIRALRIGIVTRSPQREKENAAGNCEAKITAPG